MLLGKRLGFGSGFVVLAGLAQCLVVWVAMVGGLAAASFVRKDL